MDWKLVLCVLALIAAANTVASVAMVRSSNFRTWQVAGLLMVIWLVPIAGAILVIAFLRTDLDVSVPSEYDRDPVGGLDGSPTNRTDTPQGFDGGGDGGE